MTYLIPNDYIGRQSRSALPNAPVTPVAKAPTPRTSPAVRRATVAVLRWLARKELQWARRLERHPRRCVIESG